MNIIFSTYRVYDSLFHTMLILNLIGPRQRMEFEIYWQKVIRDTL